MWPEGQQEHGSCTRKGWETTNPFHTPACRNDPQPLVGCWRLMLEAAEAQHMTDAVERGVEELRGLLGGIDAFAIHASP
jgi:hypothetical protein